MPSKKRKYNARFPAGRIKKIMQTDEEVGKVAQAVPVIISRTLELFVESLLTKAMEITNAKNAKTLSPSHMKQCILSESRFDFLKDLVKNIPDINNEDNIENTSTNNSNSSPTTPITGGNNLFETSSSSTLLSTISSTTSKISHHQIPSTTVAVPHCSNQVKEVSNKTSNVISPPPLVPHNTPYNNLPTSYSANFYTEQHPSTTTSSISSISPVKPPTSSVIQYNTTIVGASSNIVNSNNGPPPQPIFHIAIKKPDDTTKSAPEIPPLIPIMQHSDINLYNFSSNNDNLCTDDDYDN